MKTFLRGLAYLMFVAAVILLLVIPLSWPPSEMEDAAGPALSATILLIVGFAALLLARDDQKNSVWAATATLAGLGALVSGVTLIGSGLSVPRLLAFTTAAVVTAFAVRRLIAGREGEPGETESQVGGSS